MGNVWPEFFTEADRVIPYKLPAPEHGVDLHASLDKSGRTGLSMDKKLKDNRSSAYVSAQCSSLLWLSRQIDFVLDPCDFHVEEQRRNATGGTGYYL